MSSKSKRSQQDKVAPVRVGILAIEARLAASIGQLDGTGCPWFPRCIGWLLSRA